MYIDALIQVISAPSECGEGLSPLSCKNHKKRSRDPSRPAPEALFLPILGEAPLNQLQHVHLSQRATQADRTEAPMDPPRRRAPGLRETGGSAGSVSREKVPGGLTEHQGRRNQASPTGPEIVDFGGLGGPGRPGNLPERWGASPPTFLEGFRAAGGRPDPQNQRFPVRSEMLGSFCPDARLHRPALESGSNEGS